jgi:hypothetical protein
MPGAGLAHGPPATRNAGGSHHRFSHIVRHSLRDGFNAYNVLSLVTGLVCHHHRPIIIRRLDPSVGRSGPHALAVRGPAARLAAHTRPSHPAPNVRDDREAPLLVESGRAYIATISEKKKEKNSNGSRSGSDLRWRRAAAP